MHNEGNTKHVLILIVRNLHPLHELWHWPASQRMVNTFSLYRFFFLRDQQNRRTNKSYSFTNLKSHQVQPCLLDMEYFSMMAVRRSRENLCSRLSCPADWLVICREATEWLRRLEIWKLGHRKLNTEQETMFRKVTVSERWYLFR